jgi:hypothetical protein
MREAHYSSHVAGMARHGDNLADISAKTALQLHHLCQRLLISGPNEVMV